MFLYLGKKSLWVMSFPAVTQWVVGQTQQGNECLLLHSYSTALGSHENNHSSNTGTKSLTEQGSETLSNKTCGLSTQKSLSLFQGIELELSSWCLKRNYISNPLTYKLGHVTPQKKSVVINATSSKFRNLPNASSMQKWWLGHKVGGALSLNPRMVETSHWPEISTMDS